MEIKTFKKMQNILIKKGFINLPKDTITGEDYDIWTKEKFKMQVDKTKDKLVKRILLGIDIDGVFNPCRLIEKNEPQITKTTVYYLNKILEAVPNCDVLITSSWGNKDNKTTEALCKQGFLYPKRIVGNIDTLSENYSKTKEIIKWMDKNSKYSKIICIDDELILFDYFEDKYGANKYNVVEIRSDIGLDETKSYEVVCKLLGFNFRFWN